MRLCIVGGSPLGSGGVEIFCARAFEAIRTHWNACDVVWVPAETTYMRFSRLPRLFRGLRSLRRAHRTPIDIVWLNISNLPDMLYLCLAKFLGIPVIVTLHLGANSRLQRNVILRITCRFLLRFANRVALLFEGQDVEIDLPGNVPRSVIRTFLPEESFRPHRLEHRDEDVVQIIHAGRLTADKGILLMIDLCAALKKAKVPFSARIVGHGEEAIMSEIHERIKSNGLETRISLSGWLEGPALLQALRESDLLIHLSRLDSFPLTVLEAMASGALPIAIDMAGVRIMTGPYGGKLVDTSDPIPEAVSWISQQSLANIRSHGGEMGVRVRRDYSWSECVVALRAAVGSTVPRLRTH